jgi:hypothetical protein
MRKPRHPDGVCPGDSLPGTPHPWLVARATRPERFRMSTPPRDADPGPELPEPLPFRLSGEGENGEDLDDEEEEEEDDEDDEDEEDDENEGGEDDDDEDFDEDEPEE